MLRNGPVRRWSVKFAHLECVFLSPVRVAMSGEFRSRPLAEASVARARMWVVVVVGYAVMRTLGQFVPACG